MRSLSILMLLLTLSPLTAQDDFLRSLAVEVCSCLSADGVDLSEASALECLAVIATRHKKKLRHRYDLDVAFADQRDVLSEWLIDDLLEVCPLLRTIRPEDEQREFRWADGRPSHELFSPQFTAPKRPPADAPATITSEPPAVWRASGTLITQPGSKGLRLRTADGKEMMFDLPAAAARKRDFDPGDEVSLTYRREWRVNEGKIVLVVLAID